MLRVSQVAPSASYDSDSQKMVLWFDSPALGRIVLCLARGGPREWSTDAASRFLSATGLSWTVHPSRLSDDLFRPTDFSGLPDSAP